MNGSKARAVWLPVEDVRTGERIRQVAASVVIGLLAVVSSAAIVRAEEEPAAATDTAVEEQPEETPAPTGLIEDAPEEDIPDAQAPGDEPPIEDEPAPDDVEEGLADPSSPDSYEFHC